MSDQPLEVYKAINAVQSAMQKEGISKERKNQQQGYVFRGIDDCYAAVAPHLAQNQLCIIPRYMSRTVVEHEAKSGAALFYVTVEGEFDFVSAVDGSKHTARMFGEAMDSADKATNKAASAAFKYLLLQTFCIPTEGDNDADATTPEPLARAKAYVKTEPHGEFDSTRAGLPIQPRFDELPPQPPKPATKVAPTPRQTPETPSKDDWRNEVIGFGKNKGKQLGELGEKSLLWYIEKADIGKNTPLRNALDAAQCELYPDGMPTEPF